MHTIIGVLIALVVGFGAGYTINKEKPDSHDRHGDNKAVHAHTHEEFEVPAGTLAPTVDLVVHEDPKGGYNAQVLLSNMRFAPENVSTDHVPGEGHAHIYVDGKKISRIYGEWFHLGDLKPGEREVSVNLSTNDHRELVQGGAHIEDIETVVVPEKEDKMEMIHEEDAHTDGDAMEAMDHDAMEQ